MARVESYLGPITGCRITSEPRLALGLQGERMWPGPFRDPLSPVAIPSPHVGKSSQVIVTSGTIALSNHVSPSQMSNHLWALSRLSNGSWAPEHMSNCVWASMLMSKRLEARVEEGSRR